MNLYEWLREGFRRSWNEPALTVPDGPSITYAQLDERSARFAAALRHCGVEPGDRVTVQVAKSIDAVALYLAALRVGAVYMPLNPAYTRDEVAFFLDDADPRLVVHDPAASVPGRRGRVVHTLAPNGGTLADLADAAAPHDVIVARAPSDVAAMLYTSGTTGRPKGAMLTSENLRSNAAALHDIWGFEPDDVLLHVLPIFHVHGLFVALHTALRNGSPVWFLPSFDSAAIVATLPRASVMMGVPTHYLRLLDDPSFGREGCAGMRLFTSGSAPMSELTHAAFFERSGHRILERYGMTEAGMITSNPLHGDRIPGTVGHPLPDVTIRIVDDAGTPQPTDLPGIVQVRGPNVFAGYWRRPEQTASEFDGPWFRTGDIGSLDDTGRLRLAGRSTDMIISGGLNVYPKEIELVIDQVVGVRESAVVGHPHPDFGETPVAFVAGEDIDVRRIEAAVAERLASFKKPTRYVAIEALPRNAMGKVQKAELRRRLTD